MEKISLVKSTFLKEKETKDKLCKFISISNKLSMGEECEKFEINFSKKQKRKYSIFVSSGSSANLILIQTLLNIGKIKRGDKVMVSSLTWSTNIMPLIQLGLKPIFMDIELENLNSSFRNFKKSYEDEKGEINIVFLTNVLGFCSDIEKISKFCKSKNIILLEDNCESLGSEYKYKKLGNFGLASTFSFFVGHHISTIEGGMICTDDKNLYENMKIVRTHGWLRNNSKKFKNELENKNKIDNFKANYTFYDLGYNMRNTEIGGFIGNSQIKFWDKIVKRREKNFYFFNNISSNNEDIYKLNIIHMNKVSNFAFPLIFKNEELKNIYMKKFLNNNIEIRPIIAGNMNKQPFIRKYLKKVNNFLNIEIVDKCGFYFPNNPELTLKELRRIKEVLKK